MCQALEGNLKALSTLTDNSKLLGAWEKKKYEIFIVKQSAPVYLAMFVKKRAEAKNCVANVDTTQQ